MRTQPPDQSLAQDAVHGRGDEVILQPHIQQPGHATRRVVGVQGRQDQMPGQRGLHGDARGFDIAHLTDHDHVRILTDDGAERLGEGQANLGFGLNLIDAHQLIFHRVFHGDDLAVGCVDLVQRRVEGGALATAGWTRDEDDAVRCFQYIEEALQRFPLEAQRGEVEFDAFLVQQADDDAFPEHGGHGGNAQIQFLALHL